MVKTIRIKNSEIHSALGEVKLLLSAYKRRSLEYEEVILDLIEQWKQTSEVYTKAKDFKEVKKPKN